MIAEVLSETEAEPASYPAAPSGLSAEAASLDPAMIWGRIESWVARRWSERGVVWIVRGPGEWTPRLGPFVVTDSKVWNGETYEAITLAPSALGGFTLAGEGPYQIEATVGAASDPPAAAEEAYRRLAEYFVGVTETEAPRTLTSYSCDMGGLSHSAERPATWMARALIYSGAADLLRPYRLA